MPPYYLTRLAVYGGSPPLPTVYCFHGEYSSLFLPRVLDMSHTDLDLTLRFSPYRCETLGKPLRLSKLQPARL